MQWSWYQNMVVSSGYVLVWYPTITGSILTYHRAKSAHGGRNLMDTGHGGLTWKSVSVILRRKSMLKHGWNKWSNSCNSCLCIQMFPGLSMGFVIGEPANSLGPYLNIFFNFKQFGSLKGACLEKHIGRNGIQNHSKTLAHFRSANLCLPKRQSWTAAGAPTVLGFP